MRKTLLRTVAIAFVLSTAAATFVSTATLAQPKRATPATGAQGVVRKEIFASLTDAEKFLTMKDFSGALAKIKEADAVADKTPLEEFNVAQHLAIAEVNLQDFPAAAVAYNRMFATGLVTDANKSADLQVALQLNFAAADYAKTIDYATQLEKLAPLDQKMELLLVEAYYQNKDYPNALKRGQALFDAQQKAATPSDPVLVQIIRSSQVNSGDQAGARKTLELEAVQNNSTEAWNQLTNFALETKGITDHLGLQVYRLRLLSGVMTPTDYTEMADLASKALLYREASNALKKGNVTNALAKQVDAKAAQEDAQLPAFEKGAKASPNGQASVNLAETYWARGRNDDAEAALKAGIAKGKVTDMADTQIMLGIVLLSEGKRDEALAAFNAAEKTPAAAPIAHVWALRAQTKV